MIAPNPLFELNLYINKCMPHYCACNQEICCYICPLCVTDTRNQLRRTTMAHVISSECISCGACESTCPVEAISQGDDQFVIDANACTDCGACTDSCPVDAIAAS
jgi:MinD superfamily P-loop ATPase